MGVSDEPKMIGDLAQAHPETGLPAQKENSRCSPAIFLCVGIGGLGALFHMKEPSVKFMYEMEGVNTHGR